MTAKHRLLLGCAAGGLCLAVPQDGVRAQAFNANPMTVAGGVGYDRGTPGVETIFVFGDSAIINWTPTGGVFLPAGNVATFRNGPNNPNFAVLNRILATSPVRFDGTVLGRLQAVPGAPLERGGTIVFQTPGGMIVGSTALFDVGNLVLTTLDVADDGAGNFGGQTGDYVFSQSGLIAPSAIVIEPGARITALNQGSYIAVVAPSIAQGGLVRADGSIAYIAGEEVQLSVNNGLFDIIVTTGTDSVSGIVHTGTSGGPSSGAADDIHRIFMVAIPKNQALTAVLEGDIGFDAATVAGVENGAIVLSAGFNVVGGAVDRFAALAAPPPPGGNASFHIRGGTIGSDLFGFAVTDLFASGATTGSLLFQQDASLTANGRAHLFAGAGQSVRVLGNLLVSAAQPGEPIGGQVDLVGGEAMVFASGGGLVLVDGNVTVDASAVGGSGIALGLFGTGTGGTAAIFGDAGIVQIGGNALVLAGGSGAQPPAPLVQGTAGFGGEARVQALNGGSVVLGGILVVDANGRGGESTGAAPVTGATGRGGIVRFGTTGGGSILVTQTTTLTATGTGGVVLGGPGNVGGLGQGGSILVTMAGGTITLNGIAALNASGFGGLAPSGGDGRGGGITLDILNGQLQFAGAPGIAAIGQGGDSNLISGSGGDGFGGTIAFTARSGGGGSRIAGGDLEIDAGGFGGAGGGGGVGAAAGDGGDGRGGSVTLVAEAGNGALDFGAVSVNARGSGGTGGAADNPVDGGDGGDGAGGVIVVGTSPAPGGGPVAGSARFASLDLDAGGLGADGGPGGGGGDGAGGSVTIVAGGAPVTIAAPVVLEVDGRAGPDGQATGGRLRLAASGAGGTLTAADIVGTASALGGVGTVNLAGEWHVEATAGGAINLANLNLTATGSGLPGVPAFSSLEPLGGTITVTQLATLTTPGEIRVLGSGAGRILGGRYTLAAGTDFIATHAAPAPGGATIDVADLTVTATGDLRVGTGSLLRAANRIELTSGGAGRVDGGVLGREILVQGGTISIAATGSVGGTDTTLATLRTPGTITVAGQLLGRQLLLASSDLDIQAGGMVGAGGTELVTLEIAAPVVQGVAQPTILGGTLQGTGYTLTDAEAGRMRAGTLRINAPGLGNQVAVLIRDLNLNGGGAAAGLGRLELVTPGIARIEGNVLMANARPADGISLAPRQRLELVTPTASLRVRGAGGAPGGGLLINSENIWIATQPVLDRLRIDPNYASRDADLLDNGGVDAPRGFVEADGIVLAAGQSLYVQNSGPAFSLAYAGITSGPGGLVIRATGPATNVTAFGRRLNADGSFTIGDEWFFLVGYQVGGQGAPGAFSAGATFNTCIIVTLQCPARPPRNPAPGPDPTTGPFGNVSVLLPPGAEEDDLVDTSFAAEGLIEEPVTSGGESSLWEPDCERDEDGRCEGVEQ